MFDWFLNMPPNLQLTAHKIVESQLLTCSSQLANCCACISQTRISQVAFWNYSMIKIASYVFFCCYFSYLEQIISIDFMQSGGK